MLEQDRPSSYFACVIDIDWLKTANDNHGHAFGDEVIKATAAAVKTCAPPEALVARWGGDEFLIFGVGSTPHDESLEQRLCTHIADTGLDAEKWQNQLSVGCAGADAASASIEELFKRADLRMYARRVERRGMQ